MDGGGVEACLNGSLVESAFEKKAFVYFRKVYFDQPQERALHCIPKLNQERSLLHSQHLSLPDWEHQSCDWLEVGPQLDGLL